MSFTSDDFDRIFDKLEGVMEKVARQLLEKRYGLKTDNIDRELLLQIVKGVLDTERTPLLEPKSSLKSSSQVSQQVEVNTFFGIPVFSPKKDDDCSCDVCDDSCEDHYDYTFGEMLEELLFAETSWRRLDWEKDVHIRLLSMDGKEPMIVKGKNGRYSMFNPSQSDLFYLEWDLYEEEL